MCMGCEGEGIVCSVIKQIFPSDLLILRLKAVMGHTCWKVYDCREYCCIEDGEGKAQHSGRESERPCWEHLHTALLEEYREGKAKCSHFSKHIPRDKYRGGFRGQIGSDI